VTTDGSGAFQAKVVAPYDALVFPPPARKDRATLYVGLFSTRPRLEGTPDTAPPPYQQQTGKVSGSMQLPACGTAVCHYSLQAPVASGVSSSVARTSGDYSNATTINYEIDAHWSNRPGDTEATANLHLFPAGVSRQRNERSDGVRSSLPACACPAGRVHHVSA
jgi:hypothetical protein